MITFRLKNIDPLRFIDWLETECSVAEDGEGPMHAVDRQAIIRRPVTIQTYGGRR